ncbi:MAG TPA: hypothetical protein VGE22_14310 [Solimonas sp.]
MNPYLYEAVQAVTFTTAMIGLALGSFGLVTYRETLALTGWLIASGAAVAGAAFA